MRTAFNNLLSLLLLSGLLCPLVSFGQDSLNISSVGTYWSFWSPNINGDFGIDLDIVGDYGYLCNMNSGLRILDISDPADIREVGYFLPDQNNSRTTIDVEVNGSIAYMTVGSSIRVVDISDPVHPVEVDSLTGPFSDARLILHGNQLCVAARTHMRVYNLTEPSNPVLYSALLPNSQINDIESDGEFIYLLQNNGLRIYDTSDSGNVQEVGTHTAIVGTQLVLKGTRAFILSGSNLRAVDISDPHFPVNLGFISTEFYAQKIEVNNNYLVGTTGTGNVLRFVDISDESAPIMLGSSTPRSWFWPYCLALTETHAMIKSYLGKLYMVDISTPPAIQWVDSLNGAGPCEALATYDDVLLAATGPNGLLIADISNRESPVELGHVSLGDSCTHVKVVGNFAYVTFAGYGLVVYALSSGQMPTEFGEWLNGTRFEHIDIGDDYALISNTWYTFMVDISNPSAPSLLDTLWDDTHTSPLFDDVFVKGDRLYGVNRQGMHTYDMSDAAHPTLLSTYSRESLSAIAVDDSIAYVSRGYGVSLERTLLFIDISDPAQPFEIGSYDVPTDTTNPSSVFDMEIRNGILINHESRGISMYDVTDMLYPVLRGNYHNGYYYSFTVDRETIFAGSRYDMRILDISEALSGGIQLSAPQELNIVYAGESLFLRWNAITHDDFGRPVTPTYRIWGSTDPNTPLELYEILATTSDNIVELPFNQNSSAKMTFYVTAEQ